MSWRNHAAGSSTRRTNRSSTGKAIPAMSSSSSGNGSSRQLFPVGPRGYPGRIGRGQLLRRARGTRRRTPRGRRHGPDRHQVAFLPPDLFIKTLARHPALALKVMIHLAKIVRKSTGRIMDLSTLAANNRIHADLLRQARASMIEGNTATISPSCARRHRQPPQHHSRYRSPGDKRLGAPGHREANKGCPRPILRGTPAGNR